MREKSKDSKGIMLSYFKNVAHTVVFIKATPEMVPFGQDVVKLDPKRLLKVPRTKGDALSLCTTQPLFPMLIVVLWDSIRCVAIESVT